VSDSTVDLVLIDHNGHAASDAHGVRSFGRWLCQECDARAVSVSKAESERAPPAISAILEATLSSARLQRALTCIRESFDPEVVSAVLADATRIIDAPLPMSKGRSMSGDRLVSLVWRRSSLSRSEFGDYWKNVHAPIAMSFTIRPALYLQYVTTELLFGELEPDGVMVMHFDTSDARVARWADHPTEAARGAQDSENFIRTAATRAAVMKTRVIC
jgi:hypothetical protein